MAHPGAIIGTANSDIQCLCCLLCDTAGMSLGHTHLWPRSDSFWAGQELFVYSSIYGHGEVKLLSVVHIIEEREKLKMRREHHFSSAFLKVILRVAIQVVSWWNNLESTAYWSY